MFPFPDKEASRSELTRDILYRKIPDDKLVEISDRAWETGAKAAESVIGTYGPKTGIEEIIKREDLIIERVAKDNVAGNVRYFSEYYSGRNKIYVYKNSIKLWAKSNQMSYDDAEQLILSHEFFHFLECKKIGLTSKQYLVPTIQIGRYVLTRSGIRALSEIGAHGFSRTFYEKSGRISAKSREVTGKKLINHAVNLTELEGKRTADMIFNGGFFANLKNMFKEK